MGRPRKPTQQLKDDGTYREDRHGGRRRAPRTTGEPARPAGLSAAARALWAELVPALVASGVAGAIDAPALEAMCEAFAEYRAARKIRARSLAEKRQRQMLVNGALREWRALAARFGLTPADRAKLEVEQDGETANPFEEYLQGPAPKTPPRRSKRA